MRAHRDPRARRAGRGSRPEHGQRPSRLRTVVVDDEQLAREELCFLLGQIGGVEVVAQAANGVEALQVIEDAGPDLVMLDVQMPGLTGFEVARRLLAGRRRGAGGLRHGLRPVRDRGVRGERRRLPAEAGRAGAAGDGRRPGPASGSQAERPPRQATAGGGSRPPAAAAWRDRQDRREQLAIKVGDRFLLVQADEVVHASVEDDVITVVTNSLSGTSNYRTLDELQARLDPAVFWRVHRSHLVNINKIKEIVPWFSRNYILKMRDAQGHRDPGEPIADQAAPRVSEAMTLMSETNYDPLRRPRPPSDRRTPTPAPQPIGRAPMRLLGRPSRMVVGRDRCRRWPAADAGAPRGRAPAAIDGGVASASSRVGRGSGRVAEDAGLGGGLRDADRHVRLPGRARRRPEHGADARRSGSPDRQQARLPHRRAADRRHRHALLPAQSREVVRQAGDRGGRRPGAHRRRPGLPQRRADGRRLRADRVPQPRRLGPAGRARGLLLRDGRPPQQQLRQPALGLRAEEVHHRQGAAALVADAARRVF